MFGMQLRRMAMVFMGMQRMPMRGVRMMRGLAMIAGLGVFRRFAVMLCRVVVMLGSHFVMFVDVVIAHLALPVWLSSGARASALRMKQSRQFFVGCDGSVTPKA